MKKPLTTAAVGKYSRRLREAASAAEGVPYFWNRKSKKKYLRLSSIQL